MEAFLKSVATYLYQSHKSDLQDICLVFPNRRAGVFFNRYLAQLIDKPVWMPHVRSIAELMKDMSGYQLGDPFSLVFDLYTVYKKERKSLETFDEFYYWGEMFLNDFDDIDKYLVDARQLFQNLADLKEVEENFSLPEEKIKIIREFWANIKLNEPSALKEDFVSVWDVLYNIYRQYKELLESKGIAYEGMIWRNVYDKIKTANEFQTPYKRFAIIGFNALNECEKEFFKFLQKNELADFFWDYHHYYMDNTWHEAGYFLRENLVMFPHPMDYNLNVSKELYSNIEIIAAPSDIGQAKIISTVLDRHNYSRVELTETAIVLADEQLLVPVLSSLPESITNVNVTLGYPLRFTPVYSFFEDIVALQRNLRQNSEGAVRFYHRDVTAMLNHPYVQSICPLEANELLTYIVRFNRVFLTIDELATHNYLKQLFQSSKTAIEFLDYFIKIGSKTAYLLNHTADESKSKGFHGEYWFTFIISLNRFKDILIKEDIPLEKPTLIKVLRKMAAGLSIPFKGEPLAGLQVMGVLETRTLDFENIIILSANEGVLPKSEASSSFIPYNLRKGFGLPTIEHQDAVYAYYFYRLLQRAKNVTLIYNSQAGNRSAEMSRFLFQLKYEQFFAVKEVSLNFRVSLSEELDIVIHKTPAVMQELNKFTDLSDEQKYLTPTALNAYLECRLRFYFRYIAHIQEKEDVTEDIEGSMFGKLLHNAMERVYSPYLKKEMVLSDFDDLLANSFFIEESILKAFATEFFKKDGDIPQLHGKSLVVKEILLKYVKRILEFDKTLAPLTLLDFEKTFKHSIAIDIMGKQLTVKLGGKIDRIDKTNNVFRVIDYKTGKVECKFESLEQLFEISGKKQNKEVLQIFLYSLILGQDKDYAHLQIVPGLYGLRDIFKRDFDYHVFEIKDKVEYFSRFNEAYLAGLKGLLMDIYDPTNTFNKTTDKKACEYCDYKGICHR